MKEKERLRELEKEEARLDRKWTMEHMNRSSRNYHPICALLTLSIIFDVPSGLRNEEYDRILQAAADEEAYLRKLQDEEVRRHWKDQMDAKQRPREPEEPTTFTIGYEDPFEKDRVKEQKKQMARWSQEQALQQKQRKNSEKEQDLAYADMLKAIDDIRGQAEEEEARLRAEMIRKLRDDNLAVYKPFSPYMFPAKLVLHKLNPITWVRFLIIQLAEQQRKKKMAERDPFTGEDAQNNTLLLWTAHGGGKESFRGFDEAKRKAILSENEKLKAFRE